MSLDRSLLRVDGARLLGHLDALARIGATADGGVTRLAYSDDDIAGRDLVIRWMSDAGLQPRLDEATNVIGVLRQPGPRNRSVIASGSHLDTVVNGGALDGPYGALAAIEVARTLGEHEVALHHDFVAIGFSNEEGARGSAAFVGSMAVAGLPIDLDRRDDDGVALSDALKRCGGRPDDIAGAAWAPNSVASFIELHIEQGPVLEARGLAVGVVEAITGRSTFDIHVAGAANHAGTTPMELRRDAMVAAAHIVLAVEDLARRDAVRVATAGFVEVAPNVRNVVPGRVAIGVDIRDTKTERLAAAAAELRATCCRVAELTGTAIEVRDAPSVAPVPTHQELRACIAAAAAHLDVTACEMPSGAGHDAQIMATLGPIAMIFVPSAGGVSHSPLEYTDPRQLIDGANVLLHAVLAADERLP